ncbi:hypothetical protein NFI96_023062, partial [Prochilodus magdalenae]
FPRPLYKQRLAVCIQLSLVTRPPISTMNEYELIRQIGHGAFGKALLAKERSGNTRPCVIKQISWSRMSPREREASKKEVTLLSKMKHPNIVAFFKSFNERNSLYIVMEYCDGGDLMKKITMQRGQPFPEEQIVNWFVQICLGLKHIHDRKVLHRDIKAQNIFLTQEGKVKLGDFGIARMLNNTVELARTCVGTPYYLSPEICENRPYNNKTFIVQPLYITKNTSFQTNRSDKCSVVSPVQLVVEVNAQFEGSSLRQLIVKICRGRYSPVSQRYSAELRLLLSQLFKVSPRDRPSVNSLLKRPLLHIHIGKHLDPQLMEEEFSHTVLHRVKPVPQPGSKHIAVPPKPGLVLRPGAPVRKLPPRPEWKHAVAKSSSPLHKPIKGHAAMVEVAKGRAWNPLAQFEPKQKVHPQLYVQYHAQLDQLQHRPPLRPNLPPAAHEPTEPERIAGCWPDRPNALEPHRLVAAAREEYLQRRQEANQYKLRAEKQLGLRPNTADAERYKCFGQPERHEDKATPPQQIPQDKLHGQQEYLRQLQQIRRRYQDEIREMRRKADAEIQPKPRGTYMVEHPEEKQPPAFREEQKPIDMEKALREILEQNQRERRELQRKHQDKKGIMFEIKLQEEGMKENGEKVPQKTDEEKPEEEDPLNQTLRFDAGQELRLLDRPSRESEVSVKVIPEESMEEGGNERRRGAAEEECVKRRAWKQEAPQTLLNALANMEVSSLCTTASQAGIAAQEDEEEQCSERRKQWRNLPPDTLLNALAEAQLTYSTLGTTMPCDDDTTPKEEEQEVAEGGKTNAADDDEDDSDVEVDEERLEPRSDDDDTNFEESEDELREEVADSMRNLFTEEDDEGQSAVDGAPSLKLEDEPDESSDKEGTTDSSAQGALETESVLQAEPAQNLNPEMDQLVGSSP